MKFRDYQEEIIKKGSDMLLTNGFLYLSMEVRTGKTLTSLGICQSIGAKKVLFLTKKKAVSSIFKDYGDLSPGFSIQITNYESIHKITSKDFDVIVLDEAHGLGAYPKPSGRAKKVKELLAYGAKAILLSGTPTPESYSQMYHQVYGIRTNPFRLYSNFYAFAKNHVTVTPKKIGGFNVNDYSAGKDSILKSMEPYMVSYTQKEAGFTVEIKEHVVICPASHETTIIIRKLKKEKVVIIDDNRVILADTGAKMMTKVHQLCSGTVKYESGQSEVIDYSKAMFIKDMFEGKKIGVFYKFTAELDALMSVFGDQLCTDIDTFNETDKNIALQIVSGREGISLRKADALVFYNIDFSATSYWQARDRMTTIDRKNSDVYWIFSDIGMESKIYELVTKKKDYTLNHFRKHD